MSRRLSESAGQRFRCSNNPVAVPLSMWPPLLACATPDHAVYCMTKAAIASLTQCMGRDHAHQNIRINAVCPNEVNTPMLRSGFEKRGFDPVTAVAELGKTVPLGRIAEPEDIADVVIFLVSDASRYLCGSLIEVNGGKPVS